MYVNTSLKKNTPVTTGKSSLYANRPACVDCENCFNAAYVSVLYSVVSMPKNYVSNAMITLI